MFLVDGITKTLPDGKGLLRGVRFRIGRGEFVGILGASGAGKSLTLRCMMGLVTPTSGAITFAPDDAETFDIVQSRGGTLRRARSRMGVIFQAGNLVNRLTVLDNVLAGRLGSISSLRSTLLGFNAAEIRDAYAALDRFGMASFADRRAETLSGGEMQRVAIARVLFQRPAILLADEPISSLDPRNARQIMTTLAGLVTEMAVAGVFHQPELAARYCSRIIAIKEGAVVYDGSPVLDSDLLTEIYGAERDAVLSSPLDDPASGSRVPEAPLPSTADTDLATALARELP